jgi:hypothetical protein
MNFQDDFINRLTSDERSYRPGLLGAKDAGLFKPR